MARAKQHGDRGDLHLNGRKLVYLDHKPKKVALLCMGPSCTNYLEPTLTQEFDPDWVDEVWAINMAVNAFRADLVFWMDDLVSQANTCPHSIIPTVATRHCAEAISKMTGGGSQFIEDLRALPETISDERFNEMTANFDNFLSQEGGRLPVNVARSMQAAFKADNDQKVPDPKRTLGKLFEALRRWGMPVITSIRRPEIVPNSFDFPIVEVGNIGIPVFGKPYLNNGVAMAIGYALWKGVKKMEIYGADFSYPNRDFAESGRACVESWITLAATRDMEIKIAKQSSLMDVVKDSGIYGYSEQPDIPMPNGQVFRYVKRSEVGRYIPEDSSGAKNASVPAPVPGSSREPAAAQHGNGHDPAHAPAGDASAEPRASRSRLWGFNRRGRAEGTNPAPNGDGRGTGNLPQEAPAPVALPDGNARS